MFEASEISATSRMSWVSVSAAQCLHGVLAGLVAGVGEVQLAARVVVRHRALWLPGA